MVVAVRRGGTGLGGRFLGGERFHPVGVWVLWEWAHHFTLPRWEFLPFGRGVADHFRRWPLPVGRLACLPSCLLACLPSCWLVAYLLAGGLCCGFGFADSWGFGSLRGRRPSDLAPLGISAFWEGSHWSLPPLATSCWLLPFSRFLSATSHWPSVRVPSTRPPPTSWSFSVSVRLCQRESGGRAASRQGTQTSSSRTQCRPWGGTFP